jgi:hypothetical protein
VVVTNYLWRARMADIVAAVAPGGVLLYETFAAGNETVGKPSRPDFLLQPGELLAACAGLRVVAYEDGFLPGPGALRAAHRGRAPGADRRRRARAPPRSRETEGAGATACRGAGVSRIGAFVHRQRDSPWSN